MKGLLWGIVLIVLVGIGGLVYRNAAEHPTQQIACPLDAELCPDGTSVSRTGSSCTFPVCPPPNVSLADAKIAFALPAGLVAATPPDAASLMAYEEASVSSTSAASIVIRHYAVDASSTPLKTIQQTAISSPSGLPAPVTAYSSSVLGTQGTHRFTVVSIERFEGVIDTAYYLARDTDVLRFDAIDTGVANWTDPTLDVGALPAHSALEKLLATLQVL
ncbi:MAG: hypothetical protein ACYC1Y_01550 [Minisyncoccota bacterium]